MGKELTKFQIWTLFITYSNNPTAFSKEELLIKCCNSAIVDLQEGCIEEELIQLVDKKYLLEFNDRYKIDLNGILYVRRIHATLSDKVENNKIPQNVISKQDKSVADEIKDHNLTLNTFISAGVNNIGPIIDLIRAATSWFGF